MSRSEQYSPSPPPMSFRGRPVGASPGLSSRNPEMGDTRFPGSKGRRRPGLFLSTASRVPQAATAMYRSTAECPMGVPTVAGEVAPISTQPRRRRLSVSARQCPATLRECPAAGHDFGSSVRECPVTVRTRSGSPPRVSPGELGRYTTATKETRPLRPAGKRLARLSVVVAV